jgi:hypothetical protein
VVVGGPSGNVVHHKGARSTPVVRPGNSPKTLLASGVPDLQFDLLTGNLDDARAELDTDGVRTVGHDCKNRRSSTSNESDCRCALTFLFCELVE